MRLNEDKISHISHLLVEGVLKENLVKYTDDVRVLKLTKKLITDYFRVDDEIDGLVRKKLQSYSRNILEGSREWDILYRKHFDEEMRKRWR